LESYHPYLPPQKVSVILKIECIHISLPKITKSHIWESQVFTQNRKTLHSFQVRWAYNQAVGTDGLAAGPLNLKCLKDFFLNNNKLKLKNYYYFIFFEFFKKFGGPVAKPLVPMACSRARQT
jgi:hypothetical protein